MPALLLAAQFSHANALAAVVVLGFLVGIVGHLARLRALILAAILIVGVTSVYVAFILQPGG